LNSRELFQHYLQAAKIEEGSARDRVDECLRALKLI
jgi:hypothetical protein